ncbi:hypothetical protein [Streptomyces litmocidini]|uniref:hypothetical protein n=1 Tax=Streptomyces litmocidini TaxID=67318 RepID=UPI003701F0E1
MRPAPCLGRWRHLGDRVLGGVQDIGEADGARFVQPVDLDEYDIHPSMCQQAGACLAGTYSSLG